MEELLLLVFEFIVEVLVNIVGSFPFDFPSKKRTTPERDEIWAINIFWFGLGCAVGWLSTLFLPTALFTHPGLRLLSLVVSPLVAGWITLAIAKQRAASNPLILPRNHFWLAFWLTAGVTVMRFAYAGRA